MPRLIQSILPCLFFTLLSTYASAEDVFLGEAFLVSDTTSGSQDHPSVAMASDDSFVVVWRDGRLIEGRLFDREGTPLGPPFEVSSSTLGQKRQPDVDRLADGSFVVTWEDTNSPGGAPGYDISARRFDAEGQPLGNDFLVNTYLTASQYEPQIAFDPQGNFVVAWESRGSFGDDTSFSSIQARRFDATGTALGDQFQVNTFTPTTEHRVGLAVARDGRFVVTWEERFTTANVRARAFEADGTSVGDDFIVHAATLGNDSGPAAIAFRGDGDFLVTWRFDEPGPGFDFARTRLFEFPQLPLTDDKDASGGFDLFDAGRAVDDDPNGGFVVTWEAGGPSANNEERSLFTRRVNAQGQPVGAALEFANDLHHNKDSDIRVASDDRFVVVWASNDPDFGDSDDFGVVARFVAPDRDGDGIGDPADNCPDDPNPSQDDADLDTVGDPCDQCEGDDTVLLDRCGICGGNDACFVFEDGFESGDTLLWSTTVG